MSAEARVGVPPTSFRDRAIKAYVGPSIDPGLLQTATQRLADIIDYPSAVGTRTLPGPIGKNIQKIVEGLHPRDLAILVAGTKKFSFMSDVDIDLLLEANAAHALLEMAQDVARLEGAVDRFSNSRDTSVALHEAQEALAQPQTEYNLLVDLLMGLEIPLIEDKG